MKTKKAILYWSDKNYLLINSILKVEYTTSGGLSKPKVVNMTSVTLIYLSYCETYKS